MTRETGSLEWYDYAQPYIGAMRKCIHVKQIHLQILWRLVGWFAPRCFGDTF